MDSLYKLAEYFQEFPGIGPRQAKRFVYYLLTRNSGELENISRLILEIRKNVRICQSCFRFFQSSNPATLCTICSDKNRDNALLMIVSRDVDFESIEKSKTYNGLYFILGGTIPILEKEPERKVRLNELREKLKKSDFKEIIISLNANAEGEHTTDYLKDFIKENLPKVPVDPMDFNEPTPLKISVLGRGLSTGTELEYADGETIKSALKNRN